MAKDWWDRSGWQQNARPMRVWWRIAVIMIIGVLAGLVAMAGAATVYKDSLQTRINTVAQALGSHRIATLKDDSAEDDSRLQANYAFVESKLARIKDANTDARFVYVMALNDNREVYFLADSEPENSAANSPRGEVYPEATEELVAMFDSGRTLIEGPVRDSYGTWLSALAPVIDDETYRLTAVVGMDVPAASYSLMLALAGGGPIVLALLASAILYVRHQTRRKQQAHAQYRAELLSIASHELRTPLTGLRWSQESMLDQKLANEGQRRMLEIMYDSTLRLQESIEDILQITSLESGKPQQLYLKPVNVRDIIDGIITMQRLSADRKQVTMIYSANWPKELIIDCDQQRLKRVFSNIISNAVKYSRVDTQITVGYGRSNDGSHVISIQDHGIGIPANEQSKIWGGFYRATNTASHDITGTGMGLLLARSLVEEHGGRIWLESEEDEGTTVFISLPDTTDHNDAKSVIPIKR